MKKAFLNTILIMLFSYPAIAKHVSEVKSENICKDYFNLMFNVQDMDRVLEQSKIISKSKDAKGLPCYATAEAIMNLANKHNENNNEPLKLFLLAYCRTNQNWPQPVPGAELTAKAEEPLLKLIALYPENTLVPQAYFMLTNILDESDSSLQYYMLIADKYKNARTEWPHMGGRKIYLGQNIAGTSLFFASDIYMRKGNREKAVECLKRIVNEHGNEKDYKHGIYRPDAYVQILHLYTGWLGDKEIEYGYEKDVFDICKTLLDLPAETYLTKRIRCYTTGNTHAEAYMVLAKLKNDIEYYKKVIIEYGDTFSGEDGSDAGNSYGFFASVRLDSKLNDIDSQIKTYREIAEKTISRYMQAHYRSRLADIYMNDKKDLKSALAEYKYIAENLKNIPYYDPEALGDGKGFSDTANNMIRKITELMK
ncbi:MAG: hypothetical protein JNL74_04365 [Fibrobacteres bacterium]|nr:hypothetical protein [Fibrobacterota bacterium]